MNKQINNTDSGGPVVVIDCIMNTLLIWPLCLLWDVVPISYINQ